jgi:hypothetical protein
MAEKMSRKIPVKGGNDLFIEKDLGPWVFNETYILQAFKAFLDRYYGDYPSHYIDEFKAILRREK